MFAAAAERHPDLLFAKVNTEEEQDLAAQFGIRSIPTLMVFRDDIIVYAEAGALPPQALEQVIAAARALDMDEVRRQVEAQSAARARRPRPRSGRSSGLPPETSARGARERRAPPAPGFPADRRSARCSGAATRFDASFWPGLERLVYFVLFPALLFRSLAPRRSRSATPAG